MGPLPRKMTLTIATLAGLFLLLDFAPVPRDYRVPGWRTAASVLDFVPRTKSSTPIAEDESRLRPDTDAASCGACSIADPAWNLDRFYEALRAVESREKGAVVRILHYGDSPTTADQITADARALLQEMFGDAGHGFCLIAKPWAWYDHRGVEIRGSGWQIDPATQPSVHDGLFGLGGVSFRGTAGAHSRFELRDASHTRLEVSFLHQPGGGAFAVEAGGRQLGEVDTSFPKIEAGYATFAIPPGTRQFEIRSSRGTVRLFGVRFEKAGPGVVYDSLGLNGGYVSVLARMFGEKHWAAELRHADPALVVINYGTNESVYAPFVDTTMAEELKRVIARLREAVPHASILVMSPMDRGERGMGGDIGTVPVLGRLVAIQEAVALETGCAFFNTFLAMGGPGTMGKWYQAEPRLVGADLIHPRPAGARIVGNLFFQAILNGYHRYKLRQMRAQFAGKGGR